MEISSVQIVKTQNIPGNTSRKTPEGDEFSQVLGQIAGLVDGQEMDMASEILNLGEPVLDQEEEEENLLFNPMNIPWMLMNTKKNTVNDQVLAIRNPDAVESVDMANLTMDINLLKDMESMEDVNELKPLVSEGDLEISKDFSLELENEILLESHSNKRDVKTANISEVPMENKEDLSKLESAASKSESITIDKEVDLKDEIGPDILKDKEVREKSNEDLDFTQNHIQRFRLEKSSRNEISHEPIVERNIDFDDNIQRVNNSIIELMDVKTDGENSTMKVKLNPEELGFVDVTLKMEEGKLVARILVENDQVRDLFKNHINQLNDKLAKQDINIERVEIDLNLNSNNQSNSSKDQNNKKSPFRNGGRIIASNSITDSITSEVERNIISGGKGLNILA